MLTRYVLLGGLLMPSGALLAQAQTAPAVSVPLALPTFAAAHDTLVRRAGRVRAVAEAHAGYFDYRMGSLGGLYRTVKTYALPGRVANPTGAPFVGSVVKRQVVKYRFGIPFEKVTYRDGRGRKVLLERYENHQLVKLELREYQAASTRPQAHWLLVRGDYLRYTTAAATNNLRRKSYFFSPRPPGM